ncbi:DUF4432 domain-containing protein [Halobacteriales archaeon QS_4_62_28]|nr:MAG: DUF4432 domain-containing protein [Halobacteriales archaeon QS_4_62_28]
MPYWAERPTLSTAFEYRGMDTVILENRHLRVMVVPGKGGDILEFRDKRTDVDALYHADYEWDPPGERVIPSTPMTWNEHYPGGWQVNLPVAGGPMSISGNRYDHHGESALLPWDATVTRNDDDAVALELTARLRRYPFTVTRKLTLPAGDSRLDIDESVTNEGEYELEYVWQHHVALGRPLVGPEARLDVPAGESYVDDYGPDHSTNRLTGDQHFPWPTAEGVDGEDVDLTQFPPTDSEIHDQAYLLGVGDGWYAVTNTALDLGFALSYPADHFEALWYWQAFGGVDESPFWGRNYTAGLEPTTAYPGHSYPDAQRENGTMKTLNPGETVSVHLTASTYGGRERVSGVEDGTVVEQ